VNRRPRGSSHPHFPAQPANAPELSAAHRDDIAWRRLYERVAEVRDLAPWDWMGDAQRFGIEDAVSK
jgi:hypothetical protein